MSLKKERLKRKEFQKVLEKGKGFKEDKIVLKVLENNTKETRIGFLITKKVSKKAVVRNKLKRRLREILRREKEKTKKGLDLIFIALPGIETRDFQSLENSVKKLFSKAKIVIK